MQTKSAGILLYRRKHEKIEVLLVHPGGPFWKNKDLGSWSIPKGEFNEDEDALAAAKREFMEETGQLASGLFTALQPVKLKSGKIVIAWLLEGDLDLAKAKSNNFSIEWPPKSGKMKSFSEVDKYEWFDLETAKVKITNSQVPFLLELQNNLNAS